MKKVLLLCQQVSPYETSPARYQLVHELKRKGYEIYVFIIGRIIYQENKNDIDHIIHTRNMSKIEIRRQIKNIMPDYVIASTDDDVRLLFPLLPIMKNTSFIHYNLEIYTPEREQRRHENKRFYPIRWRAAYLKNKIEEMIFTKKCKLFTIQDELRKKTSAKYFIHHPNTMLIPNSYTYNDEDFNEDKCSGVVYSGMLTKLRLEPLMKELQMSPNFPLVFSGKSDIWFKKQYKILHSTHPDIEMYEQSLSPQKHVEFLKQYAVGLVWYGTTISDENEKNIGLSAGKLFRHLSLGQPVIVPDYPGVSKVVKKYKLGIVINNISELADAYGQIMENYSQYQENIRRVYKDKFDFAKNIKPFLEQLEEM